VTRVTSQRAVPLGAGIVLALGGAGAQVLLAEHFAASGESAVPVALFGAFFAIAAVGLHVTRSARFRAPAWVATGCALCVGAGAWALLPAAWYSAGVGWRFRDGSGASSLGWYLAGVLAGIGWWWGFVLLH
jgi:hypothetical protein